MEDITITQSRIEAIPSDTLLEQLDAIEAQSRVSPAERSAFIENAKRCAAVGMSIVPVGRGKLPTTDWKRYEDQIPGAEEIERYLSDERATGFGLVCGAVSGNLEVIDVDDAATGEAYLAALNRRVPNLLSVLPRVETPKGGFHLLFRHKMTPTGNKKVACTREDKPLIETRGQGGYVVSCYSSARTHPSGKPYRLVNGDILSIPVIEDHERECLWTVARSFDQRLGAEQRRGVEIGETIPVID